MRIVIHNFGPVKEADIETKRYTIFIGQTSTGKSVAAKLISIANDPDFLMLANNDYEGFVKLLARYNIDFVINKDTEIKIIREQATWIIRKNSMEMQGQLDEVWNMIHSLEVENNEVFLNTFKDILNGDDKFDVKSIMPMLDSTVDTFANRENIDLRNISESQLKMLYLVATRIFVNSSSPVYIPAERILISIFTNSIFSLLQSGASIPESIKRFGSRYEEAKGKTKQIDIDFMNIVVKFSKEKDTIHLEDDDLDIDFSQASSGMQSIIPMWSVFCNTLNDFERTIVVEEPELNLFPTLQVALIHKMSEKINASKANLVLTSHSPYILSVFDNLIYAKDVYDRADDQRKEKVAALVNADAMISFDDVAAYSFDDNGIVTYINDAETRSTGAYALDAASTETANVFNELLAIDNEL